MLIGKKEEIKSVDEDSTEESIEESSFESADEDVEDIKAPAEV